MNFQMFKLVLEKAEEPEIKLPTSVGSLKKQEFHKNIYFCFIDYAKAFDCADHNKLWKILALHTFTVPIMNTKSSRSTIIGHFFLFIDSPPP